MLTGRNLHFSYPRHQVLAGIDIQVAPGEVVALIGPNGTGKSTLLKLLLGIFTPEGGEVRVNGHAVKGLDRSYLARALAYVPQQTPGGFPIRVFDAVLMGRRPFLRWSPTAEDLRVVDEVLAKLGLNELAMRDLDTLSGGQRQKVYLARALAQEADFLLLDEPTSALDLRHQLDGMAILRQTAAAGKGVLLALHDLHLAARHADRVIALHQGQVIAAGPPQQVLTPALLAMVYGVDAEVDSFSGACRITIRGPADAV